MISQISWNFTKNHIFSWILQNGNPNSNSDYLFKAKKVTFHCVFCDFAKNAIHAPEVDFSAYFMFWDWIWHFACWNHTFSARSAQKSLKTTVFIRCFRSGDRGCYFVSKMHFWHKNHHFCENMWFLVPGTCKSAQIWPTLLLDKENKWFATTANVGIPWFSNPRNTFLEIFRKRELRYGRNTFSFHLSVPRGPSTQNIVLPMLFYILLRVSGATGRIFAKKHHFLEKMKLQ